MAEPRSKQQRASGKFWLVAVAIFVLFIAVAAYVQWRLASVPVTTETPYEAPIVSPDIQTIEDVREYTAGRPIPSVAVEETAGKIGPDVNTFGEHIRGNPEARISIVEYASLTNAYARIMHPELAKIVNNNADVNWIFRHYPMQNIILDYPVAYMSECIYNQMGDPGFWQYIDQVYAQAEWTEEQLKILAEEIVSDEAVFRSCYETQASKKAVTDDKRIGYFESKVTVIPTFIFSDKLTGQERVVQGIDTPDFLQQVIDVMRAVEA
jgi:protein-disulfide isomerase